MNAWESIFVQRPVNDGWYEEHELPQQYWDSPKGTWFQARLDRIRDHGSLLNRRSSKERNHEIELQAVH